MDLLDNRLPDRFWNKVTPEPVSGCWLWQGAQVHNGYGVTRTPERLLYAHRVAYEAARGPIADGLSVDHLCRVRHCVNPEHLEAVTQRENIRRGDQGKTWGTETHCRYGHEYAAGNAAPRAGRINGKACRECNRLKARKCRAGKVQP